MRPEVTRRALLALLMITGIYLAARMTGWTGPDTRVEFEPILLYPGVFIVTLWGLARLTRGGWR